MKNASYRLSPSVRNSGNQQKANPEMRHLPGSVAVHAPHFFPWPPMIARLSLSETVVFLDHLRFKKEYFQHRTKLMGPNGLFWAGLPIKSRTSRSPLYQAQISDDAFYAISKMKSSIIQFYRKSPFFDILYPPLESLLDEIARDRPPVSICAEKSIQLFFEVCDLTPPIFHRSHRVADMPTERSEMVLTLAKSVGAKVVLNGFGGSQQVHDAQMIEAAGISMSFMDNRVAEEFHEGLSYMHYLLWNGPEAVQDFILRVRRDYEPAS